ncbi:LamG-like jellyroll fold domain-containing protein [Bradyrhizobium pachyrhizi]|uniref:LamG-like jellyroll fold domain-containing protein n=1 Tax=Bradyrhizobium pachyrhizi TaxID=280333 RepID=UPI003D360BC3
MGSSFLDVCRFNPTAGGTADFTYSSPVVGYQSPAAAGALNGATYSYRAESADLSQWEIGTGVYNTSTGVLSRAAVLFNSAGTTAKINFTAAPQVAVVALAEDLITPAEAVYWTDRAALLDPAAYVYWHGVFSVTVPAGETWYVLNAWATKIQGSAQWYHRDLGTDECFPVTAGTTISTIGLADSFLYVCRPALVTSDPAYLAPKSLYYSRLNALRAIALSQLSASQAAGAAAGTSGTATFPFDFNDGILAQISVMDSAWCLLADPLGRGALNSCIEVSDLHQFRPTKTLLTPFRRAMFPSIQCQGASVSGNATDTIVGGSGVLSYYKLPDSWRTQSPLNAYRAAVLADTPRIYYTFDEVSGTVVNDAGSVGLNGAYFGTPVLGLPGATSDGRYGTCFNASNEGVSIPGSANFDFAGGDFTYEAWVKFDALPTPTAGADIYVVNAWQTDASSPISTLLGVSNNKFKFYAMVTGSVTVSVSSTVSLGLAQYYHVICGRSGGNLFIRVVSKEARQTAAISANIIARGSNAVWLGTGNTGAAYVAALTGRIDEFALYNSALSDARADAHHAAQIGW